MEGHRSRRICRAFRTLSGTYASRSGSASSLQTPHLPLGTSFFSEFISNLVSGRPQPHANHHVATPRFLEGPSAFPTISLTANHSPREWLAPLPASSPDLPLAGNRQSLQENEQPQSLDIATNLRSHSARFVTCTTGELRRLRCANWSLPTPVPVPLISP